MARARNIKPGFFVNDELAELPVEARLLFIGLWTIADRSGRFEDRPKKVKGLVCPFDDWNVNELLELLHKSKFITRYSVGECKYIQVNNFDKHQNPHCKEPESTIPAPCEHHTSTVSALLIPDSGFLIADPLNLIPPTLKPEVSGDGLGEVKQEENLEQAKPAQSLVPAHAILEDAFRSTYKPLALVPLPDVLETPAFRDAWSKWCDYMTREKGIRYAQTTIQGHLADLARDGPTTAAERLSDAMANGWINPAKRKQDKPATTKQQQPDWLAKARAKNASKTT